MDSLLALLAAAAAAARCCCNECAPPLPASLGAIELEPLELLERVKDDSNLSACGIAMSQIIGAQRKMSRVSGRANDTE